MANEKELERIKLFFYRINRILDDLSSPSELTVYQNEVKRRLKETLDKSNSHSNLEQKLTAAGASGAVIVGTVGVGVPLVAKVTALAVKKVVETSLGGIDDSGMLGAFLDSTVKTISTFLGKAAGSVTGIGISLGVVKNASSIYTRILHRIKNEAFLDPSLFPRDGVLLDFLCNFSTLILNKKLELNATDKMAEKTMRELAAKHSSKQIERAKKAQKHKKRGQYEDLPTAKSLMGILLNYSAQREQTDSDIPLAWVIRSHDQTVFSITLASVQLAKEEPRIQEAVFTSLSYALAGEYSPRLPLVPHPRKEAGRATSSLVPPPLPPKDPRFFPKRVGDSCGKTPDLVYKNTCP